jgi:hypothetical protein
MSKWIKCSERLPEEGRRVIAYGRAKIIGEYGSGDPYVGEAYLAHGQWNSYGFHSLSNVTHWQPLPNAPNEN